MTSKNTEQAVCIVFFSVFECKVFLCTGTQCDEWTSMAN